MRRQFETAAATLVMPATVERWHRLLGAERRNRTKDLDVRTNQILNFVFFELERRGLEISLGENNWWKACEDDEIEFRVREALRRIKIHHPKPTLPKFPSAYDRLRQLTWRETTTEFQPTGELVFEIAGWLGFSERRWRDQPGKPIESSIGVIIASFEEARAKHKAFREKEVTQRRHRQEQIAQAEAARVTREQEAGRWDAFLRLVDRWHSAERARAFLAALEVAGRVDDVEFDGMPLDEILDWATERIDRLDPFILGRVLPDDSADESG